MLIRTKIFITLILYILILTSIGTIYIFFGNRQVKYFDATENYVQARELIKSSENVFEAQVRSYDYYLYLNENIEIHTFREKTDELKQKIAAGEELNIIDLSEVKAQTAILNDVFSKTLNLVAKRGRSYAINQSEESVVEKITAIRSIFKNLIEESEKGVSRSRETAMSYKKTATNWSIIFFIVAIVILSLLSMNTYNTITKPLKKMEKAAHTLGQGNLDYRIDIKSKNEFASIATAFNQMANDLKEFHLKITQMGKMAAIGELAGGVAHEINNPLTGILGNVQLLLNKCNGPDIVKLLSKIERAAIRCRDIVGDLLDFSRQDKAEVDTVNINTVLDDTFSFCETEMRSKNIRLVKEYSSDLPSIQLSPRTIQQAFLNIINNAIQAMSDGGVLKISTFQSIVQSNKFLEIVFQDSGSGFGEQIAKQLFDPFFTTREVGEGTGLGLSLTYRIIKNHNGYVKAESPGIGKGAKFTIQLPVEI